MEALVLIADIVQSRRIANRAAFQKGLGATLSAINRRSGADLVSPYTITVGAAKELARGRLIGILERSITFALTVTGNLPSVALVLAAKAVARFQDLDDRDFAEYVVIGTLLSISFAVAAAFVLQAI